MRRALLLLAAARAALALKLVSLGDWGEKAGLEASHLADYIAREAPDAVVLLGDNFYEKGVSSIYDHQFETTWQVPFKDVHCKFYVAAGNHDWYGNVSAQIDYTSHDRSKRWIFPSLYHTQTIKGDDGTKVQLVLVDTWTLKGGDHVLNYHQGKFSLNEAGLLKAVQDGELSAHVADLIRAEHAASPFVTPAPDAAQYAWLDKVLSKSDADWVLVAGHFPVRSASKNEHGDTPQLVQSLDPILRKHVVHAYLNGHDHILQHIQRQGQMSYFGSGAGAKTHTEVDSSYEGLRASVSGAYGYMVHSFTKDRMTTKFVESRGPDYARVETYTYSLSKA